MLSVRTVVIIGLVMLFMVPEVMVAKRLWAIMSMEIVDAKILFRKILSTNRN